MNSDQIIKSVKVFCLSVEVIIVKSEEMIMAWGQDADALKWNRENEGALISCKQDMCYIVHIG